MKLRDKLIYIISFICSLYISYLLCRVYEIKFIGTIIVTMCITLGIMYFTYWTNKNIAYEKITKKGIIIIGIVSLLISLVILKFNYNFFTKNFKETNIDIYTEGNNGNIDYNVIKNLIVNNTIYTIKEGKLYNNGVEIQESNIQINKENENVINIKVPKSYSIKVVFNKQENAINIRDGNIVNTIKFEKLKESKLLKEPVYQYDIKSNAIKDGLYIVRTMMSICVLEYLVIITIMLIVYNKSAENRYLIGTMIIVGLGIWYYYNHYARVIFTNDTPDYIGYPFSKLFHLEIQGRVPIYPFICRIIQKIFGEEYLQFVVILQYVIGYISTVYFFKALQLLIKNKKCITLFTILYALCPAIIAWNNVILTESIALSFTVIFIYHIIKYIKTPNLLSGSVTIVIAFILTFHRPTAIIYVLFLEIFWVARFIFERESIKIDFKCFIMSTISIVLVIIYGILFYRTFGFFSISNVVVRQDLYVCIEEEYYKSSTDENFIKCIDEGLERDRFDIWAIIKDIQEKYNIVEIKELTAYCKKENMKEYVDHIICLNNEHASVMFESYILDADNNYLQKAVRGIFSFITFAHIYIVIIIELILLIYNWIKNKKVPWIHCGLFGFTLVIVYSSFIGTCAEYMRTAICALPFVYVSIATYANKISTYKDDKYIK